MLATAAISFGAVLIQERVDPSLSGCLILFTGQILVSVKNPHRSPLSVLMWRSFKIQWSCGMLPRLLNEPPLRL